MIDALPKEVRDAADVSAVTQLILRERLSRDLGLWEQMRDCSMTTQWCELVGSTPAALSSSAGRKKWPSET